LINVAQEYVLSPVEREVVASALSLMTVRHFLPLSPREGAGGEGVGLVKRQAHCVRRIDQLRQ